MATMINVVILLGFLIFVVSAMDSIEYENATEFDFSEETRLFLGSILAGKCRNTLNRASGVLSTVTVSLTRLANNRLYYFSPVAPVAMHVTFEQARRFCQDHGMHLVTVNSERENLLLFNKVQQLLIAGGLAVGPWIGFRDTTGAANYKWVQPGVGTTPTFFGGGAPTPNMCAAYQLLVPAVPPPPTTSWSTFGCATARPFICEMEPPCSLVL